MPVSQSYQTVMPDADQLASMAQQLFQSIVQGIMQILDGFLVPGTPSAQMQTWVADLDANIASFNAMLSGDWLTFLGWFGLTPANLTTTAPIVSPAWVQQIGTDISQLVAAVLPGIGGSSNLLVAAQALLDHAWQGLTGQTATGNSFAQLAGAASATNNLAATGLTVAQMATNVQAQQTAAKNFYAAMDTTVDCTFELAHIWSAASMPTITVTAAKSAIGYITAKDNVNKLSVTMVAETVGVVTGAYINLYTVNTTTGLCTKVVTGSNFISEIGNLEGLIYYDLAAPLAVAPGQLYAVELWITGPGSVNMLGMSPTWMPTNTLVSPGAVGGSRTGLLTPAFDAVGAGSYTSTSTTTFSWSHTIGSSAQGCFIGFAGPDASGSGAPTAVTVGGVAAILVNSEPVSTGYSAYLYELTGPTLPTGTKTVVVTLPASDNVVGNSVSYNNVSSFGTSFVGNGPHTTTPALSVTSATGQLALVLFSVESAITAFNKTSRWNNGNVTTFFGLMGDVAGAATVNFSATASTTWAAIGLSLIGPLPPVTTFTPTASTTIPWFGLSALGGTTIPVFAPVTTMYYPAGTYTYTLPSWFQLGTDYLDVIPVGAGGGGGGGTSGAGYAGTASTVTVTTASGSHTLTAAGGPGGVAGTVGIPSQSYGGGPGNETYLGTIYYGGGTVTTAFPGSAPGGGGGGGTTFGLYGWGGNAGSWTAATYQPISSTVSITVGAAGAANGGFGSAYGADGAVWLVARQHP
jgi:hypothetical protein